MNENDAGQVSNLSSETPAPSGSEEHDLTQPPADVGGDGTRSVPATDSGQVENLSHEQRQAGRLPHALDRIRTHPELTPAMRQRLAELVQRQPPEQGPPQIGVEDVMALLAETIPSQLRLAAGELPLAQHPEGEAFFTGDPASDADKHAAAVASEQLALCGLVRKP